MFTYKLEGYFRDNSNRKVDYIEFDSKNDTPSFFGYLNFSPGLKWGNYDTSEYKVYSLSIEFNKNLLEVIKILKDTPSILDDSTSKEGLWNIKCGKKEYFGLSFKPLPNLFKKYKDSILTYIFPAYNFLIVIRNSLKDKFCKVYLSNEHIPYLDTKKELEECLNKSSLKFKIKETGFQRCTFKMNHDHWYFNSIPNIDYSVNMLLKKGMLSPYYIVLSPPKGCLSENFSKIMCWTTHFSGLPNKEKLMIINCEVTKFPEFNFNFLQVTPALN